MFRTAAKYFVATKTKDKYTVKEILNAINSHFLISNDSRSIDRLVNEIRILDSTITIER